MGMDRRAIVVVVLAVIITAATVTVTLTLYLRQRPSQCRDADALTGRRNVGTLSYGYMCMMLYIRYTVNAST